MKIALTGTPGTGKTSVSDILKNKYRVVSLGNFEDARVEYDEERDTFVVDIEKLKDKVQSLQSDEVIIVEGHYSHDMPVDIVVVLRCNPDVLKHRLEERGYSKLKILENVEAEAMGLITGEALAKFPYNKVFEIDTSHKRPEEVAKSIEEIIEGKGDKYLERINYMEEILKWY